MDTEDWKPPVCMRQLPRNIKPELGPHARFAHERILEQQAAERQPIRRPRRRNKAKA